MFDVDPAKMRKLAADVRVHSDAVAGKAPVAKTARDQARDNLTGSATGVRIQETLEALDRVVEFHVGRLRELAGGIEVQATAFEQQDEAFASGLRQVGQR
ncbi:hypothetical protein [Nocardia iowensis]|uniref:PE domain-containing protein n=1 Tax=Nocardia iowensis TaxID=204891 RepID=A0ABX8RSW7_NOCIO|nr:hypothetical protein [Nocardia iowensis]QXN90571.1 hypothetical protein KV110_35140 [Nocardia iowensis]